MIRVTVLTMINAFLLAFSSASFSAQGDDSNTLSTGDWLYTSAGCKVAPSIAPNAADISWSGSCKNGFAHGKGELSWVNTDGSTGLMHTCLNNSYGTPSCVFGSSSSH